MYACFGDAGRRVKDARRLRSQTTLSIVRANGLRLRFTRAWNRMWRVPLKKKLELFIMFFVGLCNTRL